MKNRKALYFLLAANMISAFAQGISMLAIPWYFTKILGRGPLFGTLYTVITFCTLFWSLYAGTLIDKHSRKRILLFTALAGGAVLLSASLTGYVSGEVPLWLVTVVFAYTFFHYTLHYPNLYAFIHEIFERKHYGRVNALIEVQGQATSVLSGAAAAVLLSGAGERNLNLMGAEIALPFAIHAWSLQDVFLLNAGAYFLSSGVVLLVSYLPLRDKVIDGGSLQERVRDGFRFLRSRIPLFVFGNASYNIFVVMMAQIFLLMPIYVSNHLGAGADVFASADAWFAAGSLLAGLGIRWLFRKTNEVAGIMALMLVCTAALILCRYTQSVPLFFAAALLFGFTNAGARVMRLTYLFNHIPNNIIGRASSVFSMINILLRTVFIGLFSMAWFSRGSNITEAYLVCAGFVLVSVVPLAVWYRKLVVGS